MELMGKSLEILLQSLPSKKMSIRCVCNIGYQMIKILNFIHNKNIIHRDIKPDNFVVGLKEKKNQIFLLDFGLAKKYRTDNLEHNEMKTKKKLTGTARYASINALSGYEQSRRDDLESIAYIIIYFLRGNLPWQGLKVNNKDDRYKKICEKKRNTSSKKLCEGLPSEFETFVGYVRNLEFTEVPDYDYLRELLINILIKNNTCMDFFFDWNKEKPNIDEDNIIFTNDYGIEYNGKNEWLNRNNDIGFNRENGINHSQKYRSSIYSKPVFAINQVPSFKNSKTISSLNINLP